MTADDLLDEIMAIDSEEILSGFSEYPEVYSGFGGMAKTLNDIESALKLEEEFVVDSSGDDIQRIAELCGLSDYGDYIDDVELSSGSMITDQDSAIDADCEITVDLGSEPVSLKAIEEGLAKLMLIGDKDSEPSEFEDPYVINQHLIERDSKGDGVVGAILSAWTRKHFSRSSIGGGSEYNMTFKDEDGVRICRGKPKNAESYDNRKVIFELQPQCTANYLGPGKPDGDLNEFKLVFRKNIEGLVLWFSTGNFSHELTIRWDWNSEKVLRYLLELAKNIILKEGPLCLVGGPSVRGKRAAMIKLNQDLPEEIVSLVDEFMTGQSELDCHVCTEKIKYMKNTEVSDPVIKDCVRHLFLCGERDYIFKNLFQMRRLSLRITDMIFCAFEYTGFWKELLNQELKHFRIEFHRVLMVMALENSCPLMNRVSAVVQDMFESMGRCGQEEWELRNRIYHDWDRRHRGEGIYDSSVDEELGSDFDFDNDTWRNLSGEN